MAHRYLATGIVASDAVATAYAEVDAALRALLSGKRVIKSSAVTPPVQAAQAANGPRAASPEPASPGDAASPKLPRDFGSQLRATTDGHLFTDDAVAHPPRLSLKAAAAAVAKLGIASSAKFDTPRGYAAAFVTALNGYRANARELAERLRATTATAAAAKPTKSSAAATSDADADVDEQAPDAFAAFLEDPSRRVAGVFSSSTLDNAPGGAKDDPRSMLKWIEHALPQAPISYEPRQIRQLLHKADEVLQAVETTHAEAEWFTVARDVNVPPALLVDLVVATFVYTVDGRGCDCATLGDCRQLRLREEGTTRSHRSRPPKPPKGLGRNGTHWAVMNWALRVTGEDRSKETAEETANINAALALCAPLQRRLSQALSILPKIRRIVFRGIGVAVGTKYKLNTVVQFSAFTSTSAQGSAAMAFMNRDASGTFFIIRTLEATPIEQFSFYPEQR